MKYWILTALVTVISILGLLSPSFAQAQGSATKRDSEEAQILLLKKKLARQDRRISVLEKEVSALLAARQQAGQASVRQSQEPAVRAGAPRPAPPANQNAPQSGVQRSPKGLQASAVKESSSRKAGVQPNLGPVHFGGNVYLYQYVPVGISGTRPKFELYAFSALVDGQKGPWGLHVDYRFRTTKLRSFYPGNTWLQQGYVRYQTRWGQFRAGSFYRRVGLEWDDSFIGNIQYFDGLKLDPEYGVGFQGSHDFSKRLGSEYSLQYFSTDSGINGSLPGRDFVSEPGAHAKNDVTLRFAPVWHFNKQTSLTLGGSFAQGAIDRDTGPHNTRVQTALDGTLQLGPILTYGEVLRQTVRGIVILPPQDATYVLGGVRWAKGRFQPRLNFSQGNYHEFNGRREYILQPGITVRVADNLSFIYEYDFWRRITQTKTTALDRSLNFVLLYHF